MPICAAFVPDWRRRNAAGPRRRSRPQNAGGSARPTSRRSKAKPRRCPTPSSRSPSKASAASRNIKTPIMRGTMSSASNARSRSMPLRMSFEDVIRVAQVKSDPARLARIRGELGAAAGEPVRVVEYFKPGIDELCSILPPALARPILALAERRGWLGRAYWGMHIKTHTVAGYLRLKALAALRRYRRKTHRFQAKQREIETWLAAIADAAALSPHLALEIAECANLIKGYGDTWKRGMANYRAIFEHVVRPALARRLPVAVAADAVANARAAALADPDGVRFTATLADIEKHTALQAAE